MVRRRFRRGLSLIFRRWDWVLLVFLMVFYVVVLGNLSIQRHDSFASNFDLANMDQTVWNTLNGRFFALSGAEETISRFSIHSDLILVLISPIYLLWDDVRALLILESVMLALGSIPVFWLTRKVLKSKLIALVMVIVYLLNPGMQWTDIYDFHGVSLAIPFLLAAFCFVMSKKWRWFYLFAFLALITKEQVSLILVMFGVVMIFMFREVRRGILVILSGLFWFVLMVFVVIPYFSQSGSHWAFGWYPFSGEILSEQERFSNLVNIGERFTSESASDYYISLTRPFGYFPLLGFPWLVLALPDLLINLLSSHAQMRSIVFHYDSGIVPALVIATIFGLSNIEIGLKRIWFLKRFSRLGVYLSMMFILLMALRFNYYFSPLPTTPSCWCLSYQVSKEDREFARVLSEIPAGASITASGNVRPHLTHRENAFTLPNAVESADYVAILTQQRIVGDYGVVDEEFVELLRGNEDYELVSNVGQFFLFKRFK